MYVLTCELLPTLIFKCTPDEYKARLQKECRSKFYDKVVSHPTFQIRELTLELLSEIIDGVDYTDGECCLSPDTSF